MRIRFFEVVADVMAAFLFWVLAVMGAEVASVKSCTSKGGVLLLLVLRACMSSCGGDGGGGDGGRGGRFGGGVGG